MVINISLFNISIFSVFYRKTFGSVDFESIFAHLEIIADTKPIKALNDTIDISKSKSLSEPKISPELDVIKTMEVNVEIKVLESTMLTCNVCMANISIVEKSRSRF